MVVVCFGRPARLCPHGLGNLLGRTFFFFSFLCTGVICISAYTETSSAIPFLKYESNTAGDYECMMHQLFDRTGEPRIIHLIAWKKQNKSYVHIISHNIFGHYFSKNNHVQSSNTSEEVYAYHRKMNLEHIKLICVET